MNQPLAPCQFRALHRRAFSGDAAQMPAIALKGFDVLERAINAITEPRDEIRALEIGVYKGQTTKWLLEHDRCTVVCVDTWKGSEEHAGVDFEPVQKEFIAMAYEFPETCEYYQCASEYWFQNSSANKFNLAIVDGSHHSSDCLRDCIGCFDRLVTGGVLVIDDYLWNYHEDPRRNPKLAVDSFLACFHNQIEIIEMGYMVVVRKTEKRAYDDLLEFACWYRDQTALRVMPSNILKIERVGQFTGSTILREDRNQVQYWFGEPNSVITDHSHANIDQILCYVGGDVIFTIDGKPIEFNVDLRPVGSSPESKFGLGFRVPPNTVHGAKFGPSGGSWLTIQRWLNGEPGSTQHDWKGEPLDMDHWEELGEPEWNTNGLKSIVEIVPPTQHQQAE